MRHTDVLLGHKTPEEIDAEAANAAARDRREAKDKLKAIQELLECPGWRVFKDYCHTEHIRTMMKMEQSTDPTTLAKLVGLNLAIESFPTWPESYAQELVSVISEGE